MANKIICASCGGEFEENLPKCPFCGSMNLSGAEAEYMDKLDDVRENLDDLKDVPIEETKKEFQKQGRFLKKTFLTIGIILIGLLVIWAIVMKLDSRDARDPKADFIWQQENFPMMDQLFQEGKYDELAEFFKSEATDDKPVWNWGHFEFIEAYLRIESLQSCFEQEQRGEELEEYDYLSILCDELDIIGFLKYSDASEEDKEILTGYVEPYLSDYENRWGMTQEEKAAFDDMLYEYHGMYSFDECEKYIKKWYKEHLKAK